MLHCSSYRKVAVLNQLHDLIGTVVLKLNLQHLRDKSLRCTFYSAADLKWANFKSAAETKVVSWMLMSSLLVST